ncbi:MAG: T9SS type A sorting domain-containing protein [Winogradskyella sp.]
MKTKLIYLVLLACAFSYAQLPSNHFASYEFTDGSLLNGSFTEASGLTHQNAGQTVTLESDRASVANRAISDFRIENGCNLGATNLNEVTLGFWMKSDPVTTDSRLLQIYGVAGGGIRLEYNGNTNELELFGTGGSNTSAGNAIGNDATGTVALDDGAWHHVVVRATNYTSTHPRDVIQLEVIVDGNYSAPVISFNLVTATNDVFTNFLANASLRLNYNYNIAPQTYYLGSIDDIYIYRFALTDAQIQDLYNYNSSTYVGSRYYVNYDRPLSSNNTGTSWANAFENLHDALAVAKNGDDIWIAKGTYLPDAADATVSFEVTEPNLSIYGGFAGTEAQLSDRVNSMANETILFGDINNNDVFYPDNLLNSYNDASKTDNSNTIIKIGALAHNLVLDKLTISNAQQSNNSIFGAAIIKNENAYRLTINNCVIKDNIAFIGGAGLNAEFNLNNANASQRGALTVTNTKFINNMSRFAAGIYSNTKLNTNVDIKVEGSLFDNNIVGDIPIPGFTQNGYSGAAAWFRSTDQGTDINIDLVNNTFVNNVDGSTASTMNTSVRGVVLISKAATNFGVVTTNVANCIFWNNFFGTSSSNVRSITNSDKELPSPITVKNSIDFYNFNDDSIGTKTATSTANPLFINDQTNFALTLASPAKDAGNNSAVTISTDILGENRINDGTVDMGAFEYTPPPCLINIPDANFKSVLVGNTAINTNGDTEIQCAEATAFTGTILVNGGTTPITDLTGIEAFVNLTQLIAYGNSSLSSANVSSNTQLTRLSLNDNSLSSIDISNNTLLQTLELEDNQLSSIDIATNTALIIIRIGSNPITNINVSTTTNLAILEAPSCQLTSLDISANTSLVTLDVSNNDLGTLNVANGNNTNFSGPSGLGGSAPAMDARGNLNLTCIEHDTGFTPPTTGAINLRWEKEASTSYSTNCSALSIEEFAYNEVTLYPNPTTSVLNIKMKSNLKRATIYSILGAKVLESTTKSITTSNLKDGMYLIKIEAENGSVSTKRFIKK